MVFHSDSGISDEGNKHDKTSKPGDYPYVLFRQLDRVLAALTEQSGNFMAGVEGFDMALAFFKQHDDTFKQEMDDIDNAAEKLLDNLKRLGGQIDKNELHNITYARQKCRMEALLRLIGRAGFYPEQQREWVED